MTNVKCAVASCQSPNPTLYDEKFDHYYCDRNCLETYIEEHAEAIAEWYMDFYVYEQSLDQ